MVLPLGMRGRLKGLGKTIGSITPLSWFVRLLSAGGQMSCILSQMNSLTGQGLGLKSQYRVVRGSMDQVSFAGTRKIELRRSSEVHF